METKQKIELPSDCLESIEHDQLSIYLSLHYKLSRSVELSDIRHYLAIKEIKIILDEESDRLLAFEMDKIGVSRGQRNEYAVHLHNIFIKVSRLSDTLEQEMLVYIPKENVALTFLSDVNTQIQAFVLKSKDLLTENPFNFNLMLSKLNYFLDRFDVFEQLWLLDIDDTFKLKNTFESKGLL